MWSGRVAGPVVGRVVEFSVASTRSGAAGAVVGVGAAVSSSASPVGCRGLVGSGPGRVGRWRNNSRNWSVRNVGVRGLRSTRIRSVSSVRWPVPNSRADPSGIHATGVLWALATNDTARAGPPTAGTR